MMPTSSHERGSLSGRRVLVVEDEYYLADDIGRALRSAGADVAGPVGEVEDALRILHDGSIVDGAVLDVNLRSETVYPIAQELRTRQVPFVFTTGYDPVSIAPQFQDVALWEKPIDIASMIRGLGGLIGSRRMS
ncbi:MULTISPECIES: response regulator [unclassified Bradyrhizobium]|uniref:response regulator n=1 Tax=unclassified Bradyrhizobium TaxID=2631580 RepID=UPI002306BFF6|nr:MULTISPECIES: response regulator [unclassified Bradyrhizobium]MDA9410683.1 chemotaxis protein CheY [Bradyrhizobium sp. CCBAU 45384]MDA9445004.1 chemotaxis protein CheY [Bradyrhizobium sp. CCBAU 51745]